MISRHSARLLSTLALCVSAVGLAADGPRFYDDDPLWVEPITQDVETPSHYEPTLMFQTVSNLFAKPGDSRLGHRAKDLNTVDEVPDGPFFVNRAGRLELSADVVARAANTGTGPADGPWTVVSAKSDGITPGFTIRDTKNDLWFLKFDPPGWPGMATGAEVIGAKLFWALGYHTVEYYVASLTPANLTIAPEARIQPVGEPPRRMRTDDVDWLLRRAGRQPDGRFRVVASKAAPGRPVGRIRLDGIRADDPNDLVPAEHRRSLRAYGVFSAWLNHVDAKGINSLSALITDEKRQFIRHYLIDFGSTLGSAAVGPREAWEGYEQLVESPGEIGRRIATFGFIVPEWRRMAFVERPALGRLPRSHDTWNPDTWQPHITNAAFRHARADDRFWAARKMLAIDESMVRAAVTSGHLEDAESERILVEAIMARRARILERYLPAVNPVVDPRLDDQGLHFGNAAVDAHVAAAPAGYRAEWARFDNATGATTPIGATEGATATLPLPPGLTVQDGGFVEVKIAAAGAPHQSWAAPVSAYFRRTGDTWKLVGFERMAESIER